MKLLKARVTNYKCIDDSGWVALDEVTCLVGKNESGKTTFVQALTRLNSYSDTNSKFDLTDYPRKALTEYKRTHDKSPAVAIEAEFELSPDDVTKIEEAFGEGALSSTIVTVSKKYNNTRYWNIPVDDGAILRDLVSKSPLSKEQKSKLKDSQSIELLVAKAAKLGEAPVTEFAAKVAQDHPKGFFPAVLKKVEALLPKFFYFSDYSIMKGKNSLPYLRKKKADKTLNESETTAVALLELANASIQELESERDFEKVKADLESAGLSISKEVFEYWTQNQSLEVTFDLAQPNPNDPAPLNDGTILHLRIKNNRHGVTVPFDERSRGFVWFFSFLAYFSGVRAKGGNVILLLDEPGLNLHAKAQQEFLRYIDEKLAPHHQVIYTTHSPFMVKPDELGRIRTVEDMDGRGTVVSEDVLKNHQDTLFPLQAALGYDLAQSLFIGPNCLLVEGPSDLLYLQLLSSACKAKGLEHLDPRWVVVPAGGADKVATFVSLLGGNKLNVAVLMDFNAAERRRVDKMAADHLLQASNVIAISEFLGGNDADIEDLLGPDYYVRLVNSAYKLKLRLEDLTFASPRIVKRLEHYFEAHNVAGGRFSHYSPAEHLLRNQPNLSFDEAALDRASAAFHRTNALLANGTAMATPIAKRA